MERSVSVTLEPVGDPILAKAFSLKIGTPEFELNLQVERAELASFRDVRDAKWDDRASLRIGTCLGEAAFWTVSEGKVAVVIGHDDETWDVGLLLPASALERLEIQIEKYLE